MSCILHDEEYLGDGLYVKFDGYHIVLRAPRHGGIDHFVALEPSVVKAFDEYRERLNEAIKLYIKLRDEKNEKMLQENIHSSSETSIKHD